VTDPSQIRGRVEITGRYPVMMLVQARKVADTLPFQSPPQQSDYTVTWAGNGSHADHRSAVRSRLGLRQLVPAWIRRRMRDYQSGRQYRAGYFRKLGPTESA
jgi:hypothetical protein